MDYPPTLPVYYLRVRVGASMTKFKTLYEWGGAAKAAEDAWKYDNYTLLAEEIRKKNSYLLNNEDYLELIASIVDGTRKKKKGRKRTRDIVERDRKILETIIINFAKGYPLYANGEATKIITACNISAEKHQVNYEIALDVWKKRIKILNDGLYPIGPLSRYQAIYGRALFIFRGKEPTVNIDESKLWAEGNKLIEEMSSLEGRKLLRRAYSEINRAVGDDPWKSFDLSTPAEDIVETEDEEGNIIKGRKAIDGEGNNIFLFPPWA